MLSTMTTAEKSMDVINQVAVTIPPNSEKIIMVRTAADTRGNQCSIFETQVVGTPGTVSYTHLDVYKRQHQTVPIRIHYTQQSEHVTEWRERDWRGKTKT